MVGKTVSARYSLISNFKIGLIPMTIKINNQNNHSTIQIDGDLTIFQMSEYHKKLLEKCESISSATVELSGEVELDTAGIQLLISLQKKFRAAGGDLTVQTTSEKVTKVIELFNLSGEFKLVKKGNSYD